MAPRDTRSSPASHAQGRTSQACQRCRTLKARCLASEQPGICQRCLTSKRDCVWPEIQQRVRLSRGPSRISQVEKKIDGLVAHIANARTLDREQFDVNPDEPSSIVPQGQSPSDTSRSSSSVFHGTTTSQPGNRSGSPDSLRGLAAVHDFESDQSDLENHGDANATEEASNKADTLTSKLLDNPVTGKFLEAYMLMAPSFPFVTVSQTLTVQELCKRKPMLVLAMIASASWRERNVQSSLERQYKRELAKRTLLEPQKNLDLLQSILVYLAWYHFFYDVKLHNSTMLQIAIGLTTDLKLDPRTMPHLLPGRDQSKRVRYGKEGQRALLGCHYLSSTIASSVRAPNLFRSSSHMMDRALKLGESTESETDQLIAALFCSRHLDDEVHLFFHPNELYPKRPSSDEVLLALSGWSNRIQELKPVTGESEDFDLQYFACQVVGMELYYKTFRYLRKKSRSTMQPNIPLVDILSSCVEAGRAYLDSLIAAPTDKFHLIPFPVWTSLPHVVLVLAMFTAPSDHHLPGWDVKAARDRVRLDLFLESLCFRMQSLTSFRSHSAPQPDFWHALSLVLQSVGRWYKKTLKRDSNAITPASNSSKSKSPYDIGTISDSGFASHPSSVPSMQFQSNGGLGYTPQSTDGIPLHQQFEVAAEFQPMFTQGLCPMMTMSNEFELDQFMYTGFWNDGVDSFDPMNFDFQP